MQTIQEIVKNLTELYMTGGSLPDGDHMEACKKAAEILEALEEYEIFDERLTISDAVWAYYVGSKGTGHIDLLKQGIDNYDKPLIVVIGSDNQREKFEGFKTVHYSKLPDIAGTPYPLAWDSSALVRLFSSFSMIQSAFRKISEILK